MTLAILTLIRLSRTNPAAKFLGWLLTESQLQYNQSEGECRYHQLTARFEFIEDKQRFVEETSQCTEQETSGH